MSTLAALLVPLLPLVGLVIALTTRILAVMPNGPSALKIATPIVLGAVLALGYTYFDRMPQVLQVMCAGAVVGGNAAGLYDLSQVVGTKTAPLTAGMTLVTPRD